MFYPCAPVGPCDGVEVFELKKISKSFRGPDGKSLPVLRQLSLEVKTGEIHGLIGLSGAGKSTALRIFNLLEKPEDGDVVIEGRALAPLKPRELREVRQKIGMIFQQFNLLSNKSVAENVALPLKIAGWPKEEIRARVEECLKLVGLLEKIESYPHQLSGGQKQRVAIARGIANHPQLLLADEPTSALDPITKRDVLECLQHINRTLGLTIIITTHEMNVIRKICHRVSILDAGTVGEVLEVQDHAIHPTSPIGKMLLEIA